MPKQLIPAEYTRFLADLKDRIRTAQNHAAQTVNLELLRLYWDIGRAIKDRQEREGWGAAVIPHLAVDLKNELPELKGFSERNLRNMVRFSDEYPQLFPIRQPPVATPTTAPPSASSSARQRIASSPSIRFATSTSRSAFPTTN